MARQLLTDVALFFYRPWPAAKRLQFGRPFVVALTILLVLDLAFAALSEALLSGAEAIGYKPLEFIDDDDWNLHEEWIIAVLAGPIVEEGLFRGWLSGRLAALIFAAFSALAFGLLIGAMVYWESGGEYWITRAIAFSSLCVAATGSVYWLFYRRSHTRVPSWFYTHFHWLVWGSSLTFGLLHLTNFEGVAGPADGLMVISQTIGGCLLAYTRTRLGLHAAIFQHALFNAIMMAIYL